MDKMFLIPSRYSNDRDPITLKPSIFVGVGGVITYVPTDEPTRLTYSVFCALRDSGIITNNRGFEEEEPFNPV